MIMAEILRGAPVVVMSGFDPVEFCKNVETYKITHACVVPPICLALVKHPGEHFLGPKTKKIFT